MSSENGNENDLKTSSNDSLIDLEEICSLDLIRSCKTDKLVTVSSIESSNSINKTDSLPSKSVTRKKVAFVEQEPRKKIKRVNLSQNFNHSIH